MALPDNPLTPPAANNVSPLTADDQVSLTGTFGLNRVGARTSGLPTGTDSLQSLVTTGYNLLAFKNLRRRIAFADAATVRPTNLTHQGAVIQLNLVDDLDDDPTLALLSEEYDVMPGRIKSYKSNIILQEWGRAVTTTALLRGTTMIPVDPIAAERVGRNMAGVMDRRALAVLLAAGGINKDGTAGAVPNAVTAASGKPSDALRGLSEYFKTKDVEPFANGRYRIVMTPQAETLLRKEAAADGWRYWNVVSDQNGSADNILNGYVGSYEGFDIQVANTPGLGTYQCVAMGNEGLAMGMSTAPGYGAPSVVVSPVVDRLRRFASVGWYWLGDFARFRAEATAVTTLVP
jgi:N4-gp56 family major capsid protein